SIYDQMGFAPNDAINMHFLDFVHESDRPRAMNAYERLLKGETISSLDLRVMKKSGDHLHAEVSVTPIFNSGKVIEIQGVIRDVSEQRRLEQEILNSEDIERARIGRDMHDGLGQLLTAAAFRCSILEGEAISSMSAARAEAGKILEIIEAAKAQARQIIQGINPIEPGRGNIIIALRQLCETCGDHFGISCSLVSRGETMVETHSMALHLYRIAQEAISNAIKHGAAEHVVVTLNNEGQHLKLTITDDGRGFNPPLMPGIGLNIMRYRAHLLNAFLTTENREEGGAVVSLVLEK
ncbi:MAG TPA: sensor histidine kinase, partial [Dissulfurispiraceae bacterium]|nr:sensor histidine kinase [Dissulfurispiraceae bacterium]